MTLATETLPSKRINTFQSTTELAVPKMNDLSTNTISKAHQNEGVLRDVLDELDRERSQRAELQAKIIKLERKVAHAERDKSLDASVNTTIQNGRAPTRRQLLAIKNERDGYLEIIDALTKDRPAFSSNQTLPIHVVRLLEVIPWDERAQQHIFGEESVWEWQVLDANKSWQSKLRYFPSSFKKIPAFMPQSGSKTVSEAPTSSSPSKNCVLTNIPVTQILNIKKGYPLPKDGGDWAWIGGWRIEKHSETDEEGWSYSNSLELTQDSSYYSEFRPPDFGTTNFVKRRRKWVRSRVLVDYPHASVMTKEYLKLLSEKVTLEVTASKLSTQLVETKMRLTTLEAEHLTLEEATNRRINNLELELEEKSSKLALLQDEHDLDPNATPRKTNQARNFRSVVTSLVNNSATKRHMNMASEETVASETSNDDDDISSLSDPSSWHKGKTDQKQMRFDSFKGKGSDLFDKFRSKKGGTELEKAKKQQVNDGRSTWIGSIAKKSGKRSSPKKLDAALSLTEA